MDYNWIAWADVKAGSKYFDSDDVGVHAVAIINEACQTTIDDLAGYFAVEAMTAEVGVPSQLARLALDKARAIASITYWGCPTGESRDETAAYFRNEYKFLLESIRNGFIQVEGFNKKKTDTAIRFY